MARGAGGSPRILRFLERGIPGARAIEGFISSQAPDVLLITPLVDIGSPQLDHLAAAQRLGMRTVLPVGSWDHLSSKSLLRTVPDRVFVWNEAQRTEAIEMHGVPADRIVVTGAQCYDQWFDRQPALQRDGVLRPRRSAADRPFVLYVCSSLFGAQPSSRRSPSAGSRRCAAAPIRA